MDVPQEIPNLPTATPLTPPRNRNGSVVPVAQPPYRRWISLYGEEVCKVNTHKTSNKTPSKSPTTLNYTMESQRAPVEVMKPFNNIHGSGFVRESLRGIPPATGVVGLHNLGNSCYMVSDMSCLYNPIVIEYQVRLTNLLLSSSPYHHHHHHHHRQQQHLSLEFNLTMY